MSVCKKLTRFFGGPLWLVIFHVWVCLAFRLGQLKKNWWPFFSPLGKRQHFSAYRPYMTPKNGNSLICLKWSSSCARYIGHPRFRTRRQKNLMNFVPFDSQMASNIDGKGSEKVDLNIKKSLLSWDNFCIFVLKRFCSFNINVNILWIHKKAFVTWLVSFLRAVVAKNQAGQKMTITNYQVS